MAKLHPQPKKGAHDSRDCGGVELMTYWDRVDCSAVDFIHEPLGFDGAMSDCRVEEGMISVSGAKLTLLVAVEVVLFGGMMVWCGDQASEE